MRSRTRDRERTRAAILEAAFEEIYERGFQGVGVREIAAKAGVTTGAFFHHFPTKSDVGYAIVDELLRDGILERWIRPLDAYTNPLEGMLRAFRDTFDEWADTHLSRGCPLNNLAQEMSSVDPAFREKAAAVIQGWIEGTRRHLDRAREEGFLDPSVNTRELAEFIVSLQEATFAMGKTLGDARIYDSLYNALRDHLAAKAGPAARGRGSRWGGDR